MTLSIPLKTSVEQTLCGIRNQRARRERRAQEFGMMLASRVLRPAHVEVRQFRQARNIPAAAIVSDVSECPKISPHSTEPHTPSPGPTQGNIRIAPILGSILSRLITALSHPHTRLRRAPLDRRAAISAARRSMTRPLRPQSRVHIRMPRMSGLTATVKGREAMLRSWWHKFIACQRLLNGQRRLLLRFR